MELALVASQFLSEKSINKITTLGNGLIHKTYLVDTSDASYILQNINNSIFENPDLLVKNHLKINEKLRKTNYQLTLSHPIETIDRQPTFIEENRHWRMTSFINNTKTYQKAESPEIAYQAAKALSHFHFCINSDQEINLEDTIPNFTNFEKRINDYLINSKVLDVQRGQKSINELLFVKKYIHLTHLWTELSNDKRIPKRIIHADPKISNILFNLENKPVAIIDLDTVYKGDILYDFGDMVRSFCNKLDEDDITTTDNFDVKIYEAVKEGFLFHTEKILTSLEKVHLDYAAKIVVFIQAMRFLADYIKGDVYYETTYKDQNLHRAQNQINLLKGIMKTLD